MTTYYVQTERDARPFDISHYLWQMWNLPAVKAWLLTSRCERHCSKRAQLATLLFQKTLGWTLLQSYGAKPFFHGMGDRADWDGKGSLILEEYAWDGVYPTAAAERQILEYAAQVGYDYINEPDVSSEQIYAMLFERDWIATRVFHEMNAYLFADHLLGERGISYRFNIEKA
jgi:hypothetical protein